MLKRTLNQTIDPLTGNKRLLKLFGIILKVIIFYWLLTMIGKGTQSRGTVEK